MLRSVRRSQLTKPREQRRFPSISSQLLHRHGSSASLSHHNLPTFLAYAQHTGLSPSSTTYVGTRYEYTVEATLRRAFGFSLSRVGGRDDSGVDLLGHWDRIPGLPAPLRVLVQCKALRGKVGPNLIRELEGAVAGYVGRGEGRHRGAPRGGDGDGDGAAVIGTAGVLGILVSPRSATKGVRDALGRSRCGLGWVMVEKKDQSTDGDRQDDIEASIGKVRQVLWNRAAAENGLEGVTVAMRYGERKKDDDEEGGMDGECVLMWNDQAIEGDLRY